MGLTSEEQELLIARLGAVGSRVARGSGTGARLAARWMPANIYEITVKLPLTLPAATDLVARVLDTLGTRTAHTQAVIGAGAMNLNPAVVTVTLTEDAERVAATIRGAAKEGLIRQRAGEKAARRVAEHLTTTRP